jgi:hypothetical protein
MQERPTQTDFYRLGALATLVGGALAIIFNLVHPRASGALGDAQTELKLVAGSDIWRLDHVMLGLAVVIISFGVIALALSMGGGQGDTWVRAWLLFSVLSSAVLLVLLALDGTAIKSVADEWAASGNDLASFRAAAVLVEVNGALLGASIALSFGISPLLFGMAVFASGTYPARIGQVSIVAGGLGLVTSLWLALAGFASFPLNILFPLASLLYTVVLMWAGWLLWKNNATVGGPANRSTVTPTEDTTVTPGLL